MTGDERIRLVMMGFYETCWICERGTIWVYSFHKFDQAVGFYKSILGIDNDR